MRKVFLYFFISIVTLAFFMTNADAARFGGGKSFGMSRSFHSNGTFNAGSSTVTRPFQAAAQPSSASKWLGPLAGFAAGGLLGSLFAGHGFGGSGILSWLLIGGLAFFAWRFFSSKMQPINQSSAFQYQPAQNSAYNAGAPEPVAIHPAGFDEAAFLRQAKTIFIRLQADYDSKNSHDIRAFTTPEVFAEIQLQLQERGDAPNQTEVVNINATLQDIAMESQSTIASVLFSGLIREQPGSEPVTIHEVWHFVKNNNAEDWLVAGVQQG